MSFSWRTLAAIFVMVLLVCGCTAINQLLQEDEITGPSWDTEFALPLIPNQNLKVGEILADFLDFEGDEEGEVIRMVMDLEFMEPEETDLAEGIDLTGELMKESLEFEAFKDIEGFLLDMKEDLEMDKSYDEQTGDKKEDLDGELDNKLRMPQRNSPNIVGDIDRHQDRYPFPFDEVFTEFSSVTFAEGEITVEFENQLDTPVTYMKVALYNFAGFDPGDPENLDFLTNKEPVTFDETDVSINHGATETFTLSLEDKTMEDEIGLIISIDAEGADGLFRVKADISNPVIAEAELVAPIKVEETVTEDMADFPVEVSSITFQEGILQVDIDYGRFHINDICEEDDFSIYIGDQPLSKHPQHSNQFLFEDFTIIKSDNGEVELLIQFKAELGTYLDGEAVKLKTEVVEELVPGKIVFVPEHRPQETIRQDISDSLMDTEETDFNIKRMTVSRMVLDIQIEDGEMKMDTSLDFSLGGESFEQDTENENLFYLEDKDLNFEENVELVAEFLINYLTYSPDPDIEFEVSIKEFEWERIVMDAASFDEDFTLFKEGEEEAIELGFGDLPDAVRKIGINHDEFFFEIYFTNDSPLDMTIEDLRFAGQIEGIQGDPVTLDAIIPAGETAPLIGEKKQSDILTILESFPDEILLSGGRIRFGDDKGEIVLSKGDTTISMSAEGRFEFGLSLVLRPDDPEADNRVFIFEMEPNEVNVDEDEENMIGSWLRKATIHYEIVNSMPFDGRVFFCLGEYREENGVASFYEDPDNFVLEVFNLPQATVDETGKVIKESERIKRETEFKEAIDILLRDSLHAGIKIEVDIEELEGKPVTFTTTDYLGLKLWSELQIRVNAQD